MMSHLSYVTCDHCLTPAPTGYDAAEARRVAKSHGFTRVRDADGKRRDLCRRCAREAAA